jgi:hypothetical protein
VGEEKVTSKKEVLKSFKSAAGFRGALLFTERGGFFYATISIILIALF